MLFECGYGITTIDLGHPRPRMVSSHLLIEKGKAILVDVGTTKNQANILKALAEKGISPEEVEYVIVTHVHLDHAGGAGTLLHVLPNAKLIVHPRGARHMIDPTKLIAGARAVYGETFDTLFGEIAPIDADSVIVAEDQFKLDFYGRTLTFLDTPGHAKHHFCIFDAASKGFFTGDTFGVSYREFDAEDTVFIFPTTTPIQFDPAAMKHSMNRMLSYEPEAMYLTHFGKVRQPKELATALFEQIDAFVQLVKNHVGGYEQVDSLKSEMLDYLYTRLKQQNNSLSLEEAQQYLMADIDLNVQGLLFWHAQQTSA